MRKLRNLEISKSIESKKLIFEENWIDKFDIFTNYLVFSALATSSFFALVEINPNSKNDQVGYFIFSIVIIFSLYAFYSKFSEKRLKEIKFDIHREDAKQRILEYGKNNDYRISKISNDLIFFNEPTSDSLFGNYEKTICIFFKKDCILFTVIKEGFRINMPVLFSQHFIKYDLKKALKRSRKKNS